MLAVVVGRSLFVRLDSVRLDSEWMPGRSLLPCVLLLSSERDEGEGEAPFRVEFVSSDSYETNTTMDTPVKNGSLSACYDGLIGRHDARAMFLGLSQGVRLWWLSPRNWKKTH